MSRSCLLIVAFFLVGSLPAGLLANGPESAASRPASAVHRVDRIGRLEINSRDPSSYVLSGSWGNARVDVLTADGVDLSGYVEQRVAIRGRQHRTHDGRTVLVAERVTPLDDQPAAQSAAARPRTPVRPAALQDLVPVPNGARVDAGASESLDLPPGRVLVGPPATAAPLMIAPPPDYGIYGGEFDPYQHSQGCPDCGQFSHGPVGQIPLAPGLIGGCGSPEWFWLRGEYLLWWYNGMRVPPLVTTSPASTPRANAGVLGEDDTRVLFGDERINGDDPVSGFRIRSGFWVDSGKRMGVEGEFFWLGQARTRFSATSTGNPILARPFFDMTTGEENAELIAFPQLIQGTVAVDATTQLRSAGVWGRLNACCSDGPSLIGYDGRGTGDGHRVDWIAGYRWMRLNEGLSVFENLTAINPPGAFQIRDSFQTENNFHGGELGVIYEARRGRWMLELLGKLALGTNRQVVRIDGVSVIDEAGEIETFTGGILAQRTNIGRHRRNDFATIPQLGATVGFQVTERLRATAGYNFVYFSNVVRPGDQIDLDVNPNLFPPEADPFSGPLRPRFVFRETDFWAHGFNLGADFRF